MVTNTRRINLCNVRVDAYSLDEVVSKIIESIPSNQGPKYVVTPNAHHLVMLQQDKYFQTVYEQAFLSVPDGVPLLWAARLLGTPLKGRVNGTDLFEKLCATAAKNKLKVFFLGGRPGAAKLAAETLRSRLPEIHIAGVYCPPYGFENDVVELDKIRNEIRVASPHILFVGLGAPKQEKWIYENYKSLEIPISIGIGVSFELVSGVVNRAPVIMQKLGLEWLFRLIMEPQRLWKRYIFGNILFTLLVVKQWSSLLKRNVLLQSE